MRGFGFRASFRWLRGSVEHGLDHAIGLIDLESVEFLFPILPLLPAHEPGKLPRL